MGLQLRKLASCKAVPMERDFFSPPIINDLLMGNRMICGAADTELRGTQTLRTYFCSAAAEIRFVRRIGRLKVPCPRHKPDGRVFGCVFRMCFLGCVFW